ncbi:MAG: hypothetical protein JJU13_11065 [Balneolaceae bacterium]|nr:hypothetical protein [Balneolaceae bacterium]
MEKITNTIPVPVLEKLLAVLVSLSSEKPLHEMVFLFFDKLPQLFNFLYGKNSKRIDKDALHQLFTLEKTLSPAHSRVREIAKSMFVNPEHTDVSIVLVPSLLSTETPSKLMIQLLEKI